MAQTQTQTTLIAGNTYPHREALKGLGARWDAVAKGWRVPAERAAEAQQLVNGSGAGAAAPKGRAAAAKPATKRARKPAYEPGDGERWIYRPSADRHDVGFAPGEIVGIKGAYYVVTGGCRKYYDDDTGGSLADGWYCGAYVRPATDEESAERRAAAAAKAARDAARAALKVAIAAMPLQDRGTALPAWTASARRIAMSPAASWSSVDQGTLYIGTEGAAYRRPVYDDDPEVRIAAAGTTEHAAVLAAVTGMEG